MEPPVTNSPPKALTPRRCALESRPFLELPRPFLCAISDLCQNLVHLHLRVVLPVTDGSLILLLALELEHQNLVATAMGGDGALHARLAEGGAGYDFVRIVHHRQHAAELDLGADVAGESFDFNNISGSDAVLLTAA